MKTVWTDTNHERAAISFSKRELEAIRDSLEAEETELICLSSMNDPRMEEDLMDKANYVGMLKNRITNVIEFMNNK